MDNSERVGYNSKGDEIPIDIIMGDLDAYLDDIDGRLTISRMVNDSVIKGMVIAVEQEAAERIAEKELEVVGLKEMLHIYHVGDDETRTPVVYNEPRGAAGTGVEQDRLIGYVESFRIAANEQLKQLKKEINKIRGVGSIRRISSGSELVGLGGILPEKAPERWIYVDKTFESLKDNLDSFCRRMEVMAQLSNKSFSEWQQVQEFRSEIEGMVIGNCIRSLQQEFEQKLWDQNTQIYDSESGNWFDKLKEISILRQELDSISKTISISENVQLISHSSLENGDEWCNNKRTDHFHCRLSTNHLSPSTVEGNGNHEDSKDNKPENLDPVSLKHLSREELVARYNSEITKMRRNHESQVQEMTEENFRLRRELLRERGPSLPLKRDKEFDMLRKKIPDFISKLDNILVGNEKVHPFNENIESLSTLKDRLESLLSENHQLRDTLMDKKKEFKSLSSQLSDAVEKLLQQQLKEKNLLQRIQKLECDIGDSHAEFSVIQDVYKCLLEEFMGEFRCIAEESHLKHTPMEEMYEIIFKEAGHGVQPSSKSEIEDADMESVIRLGLLDVIFKETLMDAEEKLRSLNEQYVNENHIRVNLERESFKNKEALRLEAAEKEKLKQEMLMLTSKLEEKEKVAQEVGDALIEEKSKMELASKVLNSLRAQTVRQQKVINTELDVTKGNLVEALKEVEQYKEEMYKLHQNLEQRTKELREIDEVLNAVTQEKQDALMQIEAREMETRKQMESTIVLVRELLTAVSGFESRVNKDISRNCLRLESTSSVFHCLINKANILKTTGLLYKQRLETRCSDLEKAEAEVDLLADEVDTLRSLLEEIYKKLDHYSPILRHYPGITKILELVRRELIGESTKPV